MSSYRVHGDKDSKLWVHVDSVSVSENELLPLLLFASEDHRDLLSRH